MYLEKKRVEGLVEKNACCSPLPSRFSSSFFFLFQFVHRLREVGALRAFSLIYILGAFPRDWPRWGPRGPAPQPKFFILVITYFILVGRSVIVTRKLQLFIPKDLTKIIKIFTNYILTKKKNTSKDPKNNVLLEKVKLNFLEKKSC